MESSTTKSSLIILYHRKPYIDTHERSDSPKKISPNGIIPTLTTVISKYQDSKWVCWKDQEEKDNSKGDSDLSQPFNEKIVYIPLSKQQINDFYYITSKETFWPILHSFPCYCNFEKANWENFREVNKLFAQTACSYSTEETVFWIHDYNLWLTPYYIRKYNPKAHIAYFHHTPFPAADIFNIIPWNDEIIKGLLCCDLIGFHIPRYVENFVATSASLENIEIIDKSPTDTLFLKQGNIAEPKVTKIIRYQEREIALKALPVGIDVNYIQSFSSNTTDELISKLARAGREKKIIISVSRLDYTKGITEMLLTFEELLNRNEDLHGKIHFLLIAVDPNSQINSYNEIQTKLRNHVSRINGSFRVQNWQPVEYINENITFERLIPIYKLADICWVNSLRDGLNLVAKEYIAARDGKDGVLVLSKYAGCAAEFPEAVLTNPYSIDSMGDALKEAIYMDPTEQNHRMKILFEKVKKNDVHLWVEDMLQEITDLKHKNDYLIKRA